LPRRGVRREIDIMVMVKAELPATTGVTMPSGPTTPPTRASAQIKRSQRKKRPSYEVAIEVDSQSFLPSLSDSGRFLSAHHTALVATFVMGFFWFGYVVEPLAHTRPFNTRTVHHDNHVSTRWQEMLGMALATGSVGLAADGPRASRHLDRPRTYMSWTALPSEEALGLSLATGRASFVIDQAGRPPSHVQEAARPAMDGAPGSLAFAVTAALIHTLIVFVGLAIGRDTLSVGDWWRTLLHAGGAVFLFLCPVLWWACEFNIGPVPEVGAALFPSQASFVLSGAASLSMWLCCSMIIPHSVVGRLFTQSPALHLGLVVACFALHLLGASVSEGVVCLGAISVASVLLARHQKGASVGTPAAWNL